MDSWKPEAPPTNQPIRSPVYFLRGLFLVCSSFALLSLLFSLNSGVVRGGDSREEPDFANLFEEIDEKLSTSYLDLERIQPRPLLERALSSLELSAEEIYVERFEPSKPYVAMHVEDEVEMLDLHSVKTRRDSVVFLENVFEFLRLKYHGDNTLNELRYAAANGYLSGIDPHTLVFTPKSFEEFEIHIRGEIYGVGMMVGGTPTGKLEVKQVLKDTPARRAGFQKGDLIAKINDESTINMTVIEAVHKIRGPLGTKVVLTVKRRGKDDVLETKSIAVKRDRVTIKSVESKLITNGVPGGGRPGTKGGVGYVKVTNFDQKTTPALLENLIRLRQSNDGPLGGLILDLRGNTGGLLTQAVAMADIFLKSGDIVVTAKKGDRLQPTRATYNRQEPDYPMILLADAESASGAEIVLGALQKNNRAIVLGTQTFGKGSVQQLQRLPHGAQLKITVSEYLIPGNISIQENGVVPDVLARLVTLDETYFDLFPTEHVHKEKDYESHIVSKYKRDEEPRYRVAYLYRPPEKSEDSPSASERFISGDLDPKADPLVKMALKVLEVAARGGEKEFDPKKVLDASAGEFAALRKEFYGEIVEHLKTLGIDWSDGPASRPKKDEVELDVTYELREEPSKDAEDPVPVNMLVVSAKLTNKGKAPLYRAKGISRSEYNLYRHREFLFGKVSPGESVTRQHKVRLPYFPRAQNNLFAIDVSGEDGEDGEGEAYVSRDVEIVLARRERPSFAYSAELKDASGERLGKLSVADDVTMSLRIHNTGKGPAYKGVAILRNKAGRRIFLKRGRREFSDLQAGGTTDVTFQFDVRDGKPREAFEFELVIYDSYSGESLSRKLSILPAGERGKDFPNGKFVSPPEVELKLVRREKTDEVLVTDQEELVLTATVRSNSQNFKAWVTNLPLSSRTRIPDKIYFASSGGREELRFKTPVVVSEGAHLLTVVAKDADGLEMRRSVMVRKR
ncbi:MAG: S41 family peptidase [Planctomycetota bacterium]|nr:S41 family peptidase [Planctomycetota bacterium]